MSANLVVELRDALVARHDTASALSPASLVTAAVSEMVASSRNLVPVAQEGIYRRLLVSRS